MLDDKFLTVQQVADLLGVSQSTVTKWITKGSLLAYDVSGVGAKIRQWRIPQRGFDDFMNARKNGAKVPPSAPQPPRRIKQLSKVDWLK